MKRALQWIGGGCALLVLLMLIAADFARTVLGNTVPSPSGTLAIAGLSAPVEVVRDREGVPHVISQDEDDLFCALGFLHAQDRLWQMETVTSGWPRPAFGNLRRPHLRDGCLSCARSTLWPRRAIARRCLRPQRRRTLEAYARGVNAFISTQDRPLRAPFSAGVPAAAPQTRPWRASRQPRYRQDDGAQSQHQSQPRDDAPGVCREGTDLRRDRGPPAAETIRCATCCRSSANFTPCGTRLRRESMKPRHPWTSLTSGGASNNWVVSGARTRIGQAAARQRPALAPDGTSTWYLAIWRSSAPVLRTANAVGCDARRCAAGGPRS